ncbi:MAG: DUF559 domain-containing protein, partial [Acidimicrobiales bacterium]
LIGLGCSERQRRNRVMDGRLVPLQESVYRVAAAPLCWEGELRAALLAAGPGAYASHHSAMRLLGLRGLWDEVPEITIVGTRQPLLRAVRVHRIDRLASQDRMFRFGMPCLAPPLALLTLGARASLRAVTNAVHDAVYLRRTTDDRLEEVLLRMGGRGRRGTRKFRIARASLSKDGRGAQTGLEVDLHRLTVAAGYPEAELQYPVVDGDGVTRLLDVAVVAALVDLEADGDRFHSSEFDEMRDERRDDALERVGWKVERFKEVQIHVQTARTIARIRRAVQPRLH